MNVRLNYGAKYRDRLSHHHVKNLNRFERSKLVNTGYSFKQAIKYGIPIDAKEMYDNSYVVVNDMENKILRLYTHGFDSYAYSNGTVRYRYGDIKHLLNKGDRQFIESEVRRLRTEVGREYKQQLKTKK